MITAIIVSIISIYLAFLSNNNKFKYGLESSMFIIAVFVGIRYLWGTDMPGYLNMFYKFHSIEISLFDFEDMFRQYDAIRDDRSLEMGWAFLHVISEPIGFFGMVIVLSFIENYIVYRTIKYYVPVNLYWFSVFIYTMNPNLMVLGCSMMRQFMAMCIVLLSLRSIINKRPVKFFLLILLATSFHMSAFLFAILYFVRFVKLPIDKGKYVILLLVSFVWIFGVAKYFLNMIVALIFGTLFNAFSNTFLLGGGATVGFGVAFITSLVVLCLSKTNDMPLKRKIVCSCCLLYIIIVPFAQMIALSGRLLYYLEIIFVIAFPICISYMKNRFIKTSIVVSIIVWYLFQYDIFFHHPSYVDSYSVYHSIFEAPYWM